MGCSNYYPCEDNLAPLYNKITYKNMDVIKFVNDSGILRQDTVHINYSKVPENYNDNYSEEYNGQGACSGDFSFKLGDYEIHGHQYGGDNYAEISTNFFNYAIYERQDTLEYDYNGIILKAIHIYEIDSARFKNINYQKKILKYCNEYIVSLSDYKLFYFSIIENNIRTNWKLE